MPDGSLVSDNSKAGYGYVIVYRDILCDDDACDLDRLDRDVVIGGGFGLVSTNASEYSYIGAVDHTVSTGEVSAMYHAGDHVDALLKGIGIEDALCAKETSPSEIIFAYDSTYAAGVTGGSKDYFNNNTLIENTVNKIAD